MQESYVPFEIRNHYLASTTLEWPVMQYNISITISTDIIKQQHRNTIPRAPLTSLSQQHTVWPPPCNSWIQDVSGYGIEQLTTSEVQLPLSYALKEYIQVCLNVMKCLVPRLSQPHSLRVYVYACMRMKVHVAQPQIHHPDCLRLKRRLVRDSEFRCFDCVFHTSRLRTVHALDDA